MKLEADIKQNNSPFAGGNQSFVSGLEWMRKCVNAIVRLLVNRKEITVTIALSINGQPGSLKVYAPDNPQLL